MSDSLAHRGPDGEGIFVQELLALGHRRLKIIDLSENSAQPMLSADGRYAMVYNGEVYNYRELRNELERSGYACRSTGDTEVVLEFLARFGFDAIARFNGMFALALWDAREKKLLLARDRYGVKPLYYAIRGETLIFGSEIRAILLHPLMRAELDRAGLVEYFTFQNFLTDRTLFKHVRLLPAGSTMVFEPGSARLRSFWDFAFVESQELVTDAEWLEELDRLFRQAVKRQMVSDVQVGAYLSGGVDSGSINSVAVQDYPELRSFTIGFQSQSLSGSGPVFEDERGLAELMSSDIMTEHYEMVLKPRDMFRAIPPIVRHVEEPRMGQSYPNYFAAQLASGFSTVVLAGTGGDELFAGYPWRYYRAVVNDSFDDYVGKYYQYWQRLIPSDRARAVFAPVLREIGDVDTRAVFSGVMESQRGVHGTPESYVNASLYFEAKTFMHGLLVLGDKLSMAHSIEERVPFLDNDLVEFAMRLPVRLKLANLPAVVRAISAGDDVAERYFTKTRDGKVLLRRCMERYVSPQIAHAEKRGFSGPDALWFRETGVEFVRDKLLHSRSPIYEFMDRNATGALVQEHLSGIADRRLLIWSLLNFDEWCRTFLR